MRIKLKVRPNKLKFLGRFHREMKHGLGKRRVLPLLFDSFFKISQYSYQMHREFGEVILSGELRFDTEDPKIFIKNQLKMSKVDREVDIGVYLVIFGLKICDYEEKGSYIANTMKRI